MSIVNGCSDSYTVLDSETILEQLNEKQDLVGRSIFYNSYMMLYIVFYWLCFLVMSILCVCISCTAPVAAVEEPLLSVADQEAPQTDEEIPCKKPAPASEPALWKGHFMVEGKK